MLFIAALLWGTTFVAQSEGMNYIEPFTYNALRMFVGAIVLIPVIFLFRIFLGSAASAAETKKINKTSLIGGIFCGIILFAASSLQQIGIQTTTAGKSGFITALYIVIVPLYELIIFRKKNYSKALWLFVLIAIVGFYLLCIKDDFTISIGDLLTLGCAFFFAGHIVIIDYFMSKTTDGVMMACVQFFVSGILASIAALFTEHPSLSAVMDAKYTILYAGLLSSGVAYTLQILGQRRTDPTVATLIMSLESVIAVISGAVVLGESLTLKEGIGCALVFAAVILAQIKIPSKKTT